MQFRINGVMLPDGVTGFGSIFDTDFIGSMSLVTGALPAEFGMRTVGLIDITTRADAFNNSGNVELLRRQPGDHRTKLRLWRHNRQHLPGSNVQPWHQGAIVGRMVVVELFPGGAIFLQRPLSADHRGHRKSAADAQRHP